MKTTWKKVTDPFGERLVALLMEQYSRQISECTKRGIALAKKNSTGRYAKNN